MLMVMLIIFVVIAIVSGIGGITKSGTAYR
jgi:hypothetical protein